MKVKKQVTVKTVLTPTEMKCLLVFLKYVGTDELRDPDRTLQEGRIIALQLCKEYEAL